MKLYARSRGYQAKLLALVSPRVEALANYTQQLTRPAFGPALPRLALRG
jgi:hypothetical protein